SISPRPPPPGKADFDRKPAKMTYTHAIRVELLDALSTNC
ncbi:MAG: hypothetical protein ACI8TX_003994, partial [Hyphomicrobiaceae bacterium]